MIFLDGESVSIELDKPVFASSSAAFFNVPSNAPILISSPVTEQIIVPGGTMLLSADFERSGFDLLITGSDGTQFVIVNYFGSPVQADLITQGGSLLPFDLVSTLAGPVAPGQYVQNGDIPEEAPIGRIDEVVGEVMATRVDGTTVPLKLDSPVFQGDILETGTGGAVAVLFIDETEFSLGEEGRMVLDELIFDATSLEGSSSFTVVQGVFVFVSGEIAANNPDDMEVRTPVATLGIRGTRVAGKAAAEGDLNTITVMPDPGTDNVTGSVTVSTQTSSVTLNTAFQTTAVSSVFEAPAPAITLSSSQAGSLYGAVSNILSNSTASDNASTNRENDGGRDNDAPAAGGNNETTAETETAASEGVENSTEVPLESEIIEDDFETGDELAPEEGFESEDQFEPEGEFGPEEGFGPESEFGPEEGFEPEVEVGSEEGPGPEGEFGPEVGGEFGPDGSAGEDAVYDAAWDAFESAIAEGQSLDNAAGAAEGAAKDLAIEIYGEEFDEDFFDAAFSQELSLAGFEGTEGLVPDGPGDFGPGGPDEFGPEEPGQWGPEGEFKEFGPEGDFGEFGPEGEYGEFGPEGEFDEFGPQADFGGWGPEPLATVYYDDYWGTGEYQTEVYFDTPEVGFDDGFYTVGGDYFDPYWDYNYFNPFGAGFDSFNVFLDPGIDEPFGGADDFFFFPNEAERFIPLLNDGNVVQLANTDSAVDGPVLTGLGLLLHQAGNASFTFSQTGTVFVGGGVINETDNAVPSGLLIDNIKLNNSVVLGFESGSLDGLQFIGNVAIVGNSGSIAPTEGNFQAFLLAGGAPVSSIESFLNVDSGSLNFGGAVNPTFGSAIGTFVDVVAGDTITYDFDFIDAESAGGAQFNFFKDFAFATFGEQFADNIIGTSGNDSLSGTDSADVLKGLAGDDVIFAFAGNDTIDGGVGADTISGGAGTDTITFIESTASVIVDMSNGTAISAGETDNFTGIENIIGSTLSDSITGDGNSNILNGSSGADTLIGGAGDDTLIGGSGADNLQGGAGEDTASFESEGSVTLSMNGGTATIGGVVDTIANIENVVGGVFNDTIAGNSGSNTIEGGAGSDTLTGGGGADTFLFTAIGDGAEINSNTSLSSTVLSTNGIDVISDFVSGVDKIGIGAEFAITPVSTSTGTVLNNFNFFTVSGYDGTNSGASNGVRHLVFDTSDDVLIFDDNSATAGYTIIAETTGATVVASDIITDIL